MTTYQPHEVVPVIRDGDVAFLIKAPKNEKTPSGLEWQLVGPIPVPDAARIAGSAWESGPIRVLSELINAEMPDGDGVGLQWHVSISNRGKRPKPHHVRRALRAFGMVGAEEDNHHPGNARHFFLVCDPARRVSCECKATERTVVESDGYRWTNPTDGGCRGCEATAITGRPCPIHTGKV